MSSVEGTAWRPGDILDMNLARIDTQYGSLRIVCPRANAWMERSVARHGQLTPVVVGDAPEASRYELVDGFKRLRALRKLGFPCVKARILEGGSRTFKVAIVHLNRGTDSINVLEEAMVVHSLYRDDGLTQTEIAVLFERHKSWVCRRIALMERLSEEVHEHLRLGLVGISIGRELARLPRGNQEGALRAVLEHRLTRRETDRLVAAMLSRPARDHDKLLMFPRDTVELSRLPEKELPLFCHLRQILEILHGSCEALEGNGPAAVAPGQHGIVEQGLRGIEQLVGRLRILIKEGCHAAELPAKP